MKMGFYPAPKEALAGILQHLRKQESERSFYILDPCAGEGVAVQTLAVGLEIPESNVYAVELHAGRAEAIRARMPDVNLLGPADFKATSIMPRSFGVVYCNPPFDGEFGRKGYREEYFFSKDAIRLCAENGVFVLVAPYGAVIGNKEFCELLDCQLKDIALYRFPDGHRNFNEMVLMGYRRPVPWTVEQAHAQGMLHKANFHWRTYGRVEDLPPLGQVQPKEWTNGHASYDREDEPRVYVAPPSWKPSRFNKVGYTDDELDAAVNASGLNKLMEYIEPPRPRRPPLPPGKGHIAMILASGMIDGVLWTPHGAHVVRGVASKREYFNEEASGIEIDEEKGEARIKEVFSQKIELSVRAVDASGVIHTFTDNPADDTVADAGRGRPGGNGNAHAQASVHPEDVGTPRGFPPDFDFALYAKLARMTVENGCTPAEEEQAQARMAAMKEGVQFTAEQVKEATKASA
jgi:predicted RNA methylase